MNRWESAQSVLDTRGPGAEQIADLWWFSLIAGTAVFLLVLTLLTLGIRRARRRLREDGEASDPDTRRWVGVGGILLPIVVLSVLLVITLRTMRQHTLVAAEAERGLTVEVVGHQWWWEVRYRPPGGGQPVSDANEIHIPAGQPVRIALRSADVVHSFWVPQLQGKLDLVPGRETVTWIQADSAGVFRGQCAEFCGAQHGHMGFMVVAHPADEFAEWLAHQRRPAPQPTDSTARRGLAVLEQTACALCHTVRGTRARGGVAPDLTHLASRLTLAAGTLPNTRGHLGGWIGDPQGIKPGNHMPRVPLSGPDLQALLAYLATLR